MNKFSIHIILKILTGILVFFTLVFFKNYYSFLFSSTTSGLMALPENSNYLLIGSSLTRQSYDPSILRSKLGKVYLLAYNGNQPCMMSEQLRFLKKRGKTWNHLVLEFYPQTSSQGPSISDLRIMLDSDLDLKRRYLALLSNEREISFSEYYELIVTSNIELITTYFLTGALIDSFSVDGGYVNKREEGSSEERLAAESEKIRIVSPKIHSAQLQCWKDLIEENQTEGKTLEVWEAPKFFSVSSDPNYREIKATFSRFLSEKGILFRSFTFSDRDPLLFRDPIHLSTQGREVLSKTIIEAIEKAPN
ncbi:hypothetical protein LPTSP3_g13730 [Leptospira kobayashii]|uniref:SGNH/GDSL hydrolase family protein n=1 Tax=Leptospira kobayashii TaxID=1917830 RepID=A0ABM7UIC9_9LEPT|nr:hypothetical protein [Leptospira kobayashii]BDA78443.1 hypothetical protein LPTSP3_g13730 [Leptospira kobayashii]